MISDLSESNTKIIDGYAPFCKLAMVPNFTDAIVGSMEITLANYQYLRCGYSARTTNELPVLSRWFELPISAPRAEFLCLVLYSKDQLDKEAKGNAIDEELIYYTEFDAEWGIVAILGLSDDKEEIMKPETMTRNAMGIQYGGSGVPIDTDKYMESVAYWSRHATIK